MISIEDRIGSITTIFLDTAPVIYYVEDKQPFSALLEPFFAHIDQGVLTAVTSPITLAECLFYPYKQQNIQLVKAFRNLLVHSPNARFIPTSAAIADRASQLRVTYNLRFADSLQLATAITASCDAFLTNDKQLKRVTEMQIIIVDELPVSN